MAVKPHGRRQRPERVTYGITYGTMNAMHKTTIYLPRELKLALEGTAARRGQSVAEVIRDALRTLVASAPPPRPRVPLFTSGLPGIADRVDEALKGFGEG
jgi:Ribbon-helix-helix protein, copG family